MMVEAETVVPTSEKPRAKFAAAVTSTIRETPKTMALAPNTSAIAQSVAPRPVMAWCWAKNTEPIIAPPPHVIAMRPNCALLRPITSVIQTGPSTAGPGMPTTWITKTVAMTAKMVASRRVYARPSRMLPRTPAARLASPTLR